MNCRERAVYRSRITSGVFWSMRWNAAVHSYEEKFHNRNKLTPAGARRQTTLCDIRRGIFWKKVHFRSKRDYTLMYLRRGISSCVRQEIVLSYHQTMATAEEQYIPACGSIAV